MFLVVVMQRVSTVFETTGKM